MKFDVFLVHWATEIQYKNIQYTEIQYKYKNIQVNCKIRGSDRNANTANMILIG